jgi:hypothetical protein
MFCAVYVRALCSWGDPAEGTVWVEGWDATYNMPYYVNFSTGESQWEWPSEYANGSGVHIVQHDSEDYHWYWAWLQGEGATAGTSEHDDDAPVIGASSRNLFGSCFG